VTALLILFVDGLSEELFARSGFAADENGQVAEVADPLG